MLIHYGIFALRANHSTNPKPRAGNHVYFSTPTVSGELMKSLERHGSSSLLFVMKEWSEISEATLMGIAHIVVLHIQNVVEEISLQLYRLSSGLNSGYDLWIKLFMMALYSNYNAECFLNDQNASTSKCNKFIYSVNLSWKTIRLLIRSMHSISNAKIATVHD